MDRTSLGKLEAMGEMSSNYQLCGIHNKTFAMYFIIRHTAAYAYIGDVKEHKVALGCSIPSVGPNSRNPIQKFILERAPFRKLI